jgi:hypothetical protein
MRRDDRVVPGALFWEVRDIIGLVSGAPKDGVSLL